MTAAIPISVSPLACRLIEAYQRRLSPLKGFRCAYRARNGRASCSEFARRAIARLGLLPGVQLLRRRFAKCRAAHLAVAGGVAATQVLDYEPRHQDEQPKRQAGSGPSDCYPDLSCPDVSGCGPDIPTGACDAAGALDGIGGCDGVACCDLSF